MGDARFSFGYITFCLGMWHATFAWVGLIGVIGGATIMVNECVALANRRLIRR